jgi:hypothetical protein
MERRLYTTTIRLRLSHEAFLTAAKLKIRTQSGVHLDKSALLRGLLDGVALARLDLAACKTEGEVKQTVARAIGGGGAAT